MANVNSTATTSAHSFHIPVMGTGFTIDTPLRVARYGITSVISLVDDVLVEQMRKLHSLRHGEPYTPIRDHSAEARAERITAYLDLLKRLVDRQVAELQAAPFEPGSEITRYFELLPDSPLKDAYNEMLDEPDPVRRAALQEQLRPQAVPGRIDVNIMTKLAMDKYRDGVKLPPEMNDAATAVRGFANSKLTGSSVVFSAGFNPPLYGYLSELPAFWPDANGQLQKKITMKVSDYRSAEVQGRYLAKRGLWVSEYRIESGLNCGGHAFTSRGQLLGPILEEFAVKREALVAELFASQAKALAARGLPVPSEPYPVRYTVQGGINTCAERELLLRTYDLDSTGWGTPFLLVPEATNVDGKHREMLVKAQAADVYLSDSSPLGVPFWNLRASASENYRRDRIAAGTPGSSCPKGYAAFNMEFSDTPLCTASAEYQQRKLEELSDSGLAGAELASAQEQVLVKSCICHDLAGNATLDTGIDPNAKPAVCCGPSIAHFNRLLSLEELVGHIYGRLNLLTGVSRPHMFIQELKLNMEFLRKELDKLPAAKWEAPPKHIKEMMDNILSGIDYYRQLVRRVAVEQQARFLNDLASLREKVLSLQLVPIPVQ